MKSWNLIKCFCDCYYIHAWFVIIYNHFTRSLCPTFFVCQFIISKFYSYDMSVKFQTFWNMSRNFRFRIKLKFQFWYVLLFKVYAFLNDVYPYRWNDISANQLLLISYINLEMKCICCSYFLKIWKVENVYLVLNPFQSHYTTYM